MYWKLQQDIVAEACAGYAQYSNSIGLGSNVRMHRAEQQCQDLRGIIADHSLAFTGHMGPD